MAGEKICVVMSTYNGEKFLKEQLESIKRQKDVNCSIMIRDDGSSDATTSILEEFDIADKKIIKGENIGAKYSFLEAINLTNGFEYYALADQDDCWDQDKLEQAIEQLSKYDQNKPLLYCSQIRVVDKDLNEIDKPAEYQQYSYRFLRDELVSATGCTMVFNNALKKLLGEYKPRVFPMHDYWIASVCLAVDGIIVYDNVPHMSYRQHESNTVGGKRNIYETLRRKIKHYKTMGKNFNSKMYKEIYNAYNTEMPEENKKVCKTVTEYRKSIKGWIEMIGLWASWSGRVRWKMETLLLILTRTY